MHPYTPTQTESRKHYIVHKLPPKFSMTYQSEDGALPLKSKRAAMKKYQTGRRDSIMGSVLWIKFMRS